MADVVQVSYMDIKYIERAVSRVSAQVENLGSYVASVDAEVQELKRNFIIMIKEQRQQAALQRAITQIISVRQELEQNFGTHKQVRDNMLGILNATDTALVTKETISRISEELMLNAPNYWLAPCLVALAAWIAKDKKLANRAITESFRRNPEKTSMLFAIICSRNGKTDACYEWLKIYLGMQDPQDMKRSVITFIDAYTSGIFGEDRKRICIETIREWMKVLKIANPDFDQEQREYWKNRFNEEGAKVMYSSADYNCLQKMSPDFPRINAFVSRITAVNNKGGARDKINEVFVSEVDKEALKEEIKNQLVKLVSEYEGGKEEELRDKEQRFMLIEKYNGDEKRVDAILAARKARKFDHPVDFATRLRESIDLEALTPSKKTAYFLLQSYIEDAYSEYITECKDTYPDTIGLKLLDNVNIDGLTINSTVKWDGTTKNGENLEDLKATLKKKYEIAKAEAIEAAKPSTGKKVAVAIFTLGLGLIYLSKKYKKDTLNITVAHNSCLNKAINNLEGAIRARQETNAIVTDFCSKEGWEKFEIVKPLGQDNVALDMAEEVAIG